MQERGLCLTGGTRVTPPSKNVGMSRAGSKLDLSES